MRLWSIHPQYLDPKGLVALWRECLLAQKVLLSTTKGHRNHPQLHRFKNTINPRGAIAAYLRGVIDEADKRGYTFNRSKIAHTTIESKLLVTSGQIEYEVKHLLEKLKERDTVFYSRLKTADTIRVHSLFKKVEGTVEDWEKR